MRKYLKIMRKYLKYAFPALVCLGLVSCKPESLDPDEKVIDPTEENVFWKVVGQLVDNDDITPDYKGKTFKANIGSPDGGDESVRIVAVNDPGAAASRYNNLTGASITETTPSHTWQDKEVGSLVWQLGDGSTSWASVTVDIPSVPSLRKIIYRSPEQGDVNGSVGNNGSAYYRFGDVIKRTRQEDGAPEYWICVRPAFGPEGKAKSHWVSVSPLPMSRIWPYNSTKADQQGMPFTASNGMEYGLPTLIGDDIEWHQDLAEMLFAIMYPEQWQTNATNFYSTNMFGVINGLRIFNDFSDDNLKYHNKEFWKNVQQKWKAKNIVQTVFGVTYDEMAAALNPNNANAQGLYLLYNGYSWNTTTSNKPKLFQLHYTNGEGDKEKNMHKQTKTTVSAQVVTPRNQVESNTNFPLNVFNLYLNRPYLSEARFFGDDKPRWIVRYATGEELSDNGNYDPQQPIAGFPKNNEVYRYYKDAYPEKNLTDAPEITVEGGSGYGYVGKAHYRWGNVYKDENGSKWFVINQSGYNDVALPELTEASPYSELVSFDVSSFEAMTYPGDEGPQKVSNLPSPDVAIRSFMFLYLLFNQTIDKRTEAKLDEDEKYGKTILNIMRNAGVDVRNLMQSIMAQNNDPRDNSAACCIAYAGKSAAQALLRVVVNIQNEHNDPQFYFWTKYPSHPDEVTQFVREFSNSLIYLQDITEQDMVDKYAIDTYAVQPLSRYTKADSDEHTPRLRRTHADYNAGYVSNYYYNSNTFTNVQYPGSMWNEPVLVFRYTRVKDMGDGDYSKTTVDGHKLTLVSARPWSSPFVIDDDQYYESVREYPRLVFQMIGDSMYLNGQHYNMLKWNEIID